MSIWPETSIKSITTVAVTVTAPTAHRTTDTDMGAGIMAMTMCTDVSLAEIKAEVDCKAQDENKLTAFRLNVIGGTHG